MSEDRTEKVVAGAPRVAFPLWLKLMVVTTMLAVLPTTVVGLVSLKYKASTLEKEIRNRQSSATEELSDRIDLDLVRAQSGLASVAQALSRQDLEGDTVLTMALALLEANPGLDHAVIFDSKGGVIDVAREEGAPKGDPPEALSEDVLGEIRSQWAISREKEVALPLMVGEAESWGEEVRVPMLYPVATREGKVTGYVFSHISLKSIQSHVESVQQNIYPSFPDALMVVDDKIRVVAHSDPAQSRHLVSASGVEVLNDPVSQSGQGVSALYTDDQGRELSGSAIPLGGVPWTVVTQEPLSVVFEPLYELRTVLIWVLVGSVLLSVLVALIFVQNMARPIRKLVTYAGDLAERRFDKRAEIKTRDELALLGWVMEDAASKLKASEVRIREEESIRTDLSRYMPREIVERVVRREQKMTLGGERCEITVLFADVVGFTSMTEELGAEEVVKILNEFFTIMTEIVFRHGGTVDKFIGDCLMAFWGAPNEQPDHAERALSAAEDMMAFLEVGNANWKEKFGIEVELAIGINTGYAVVGNVGSETRMTYTAIGEVVNTAARLEAVARPQQILVTGATQMAAGDVFDYVPFGSRKLSGGAPVEVFEVEV